MTTQLDGVTHRDLQARGVQWHIAEAGKGDAVLLLHGFPQHWWEWRHVIPPLAAEYRVIAPDLRGAGWTDAPVDGYGRLSLLSDVVAILDELGVERVHLLAHDWGALIGYQLALAHPHRVRSFLCLGPHPYVRFTPGMIPGMRKLWFQYVVATPGLGAALLGRGRQGFGRYLLQHFAARPDVFSEEELETFLGRFRETHRARAAGALYRGFIIPEVRFILTGWYRRTRLQTPTRVLHGAADTAIPATAVRSGYQDHTDDLEVEILDGVGHFVADEAPDVVVDRARTLFAAH